MDQVCLPFVRLDCDRPLTHSGHFPFEVDFVILCRSRAGNQQRKGERQKEGQKYIFHGGFLFFEVSFRQSNQLPDLFPGETIRQHLQHLLSRRTGLGFGFQRNQDVLEFGPVAELDDNFFVAGEFVFLSDRTPDQADFAFQAISARGF